MRVFTPVMEIQSGYNHNLPVEHDAKVASSKHPLQNFLYASLNLNIATLKFYQRSPDFRLGLSPRYQKRIHLEVQLFLNLITQELRRSMTDLYGQQVSLWKPDPLACCNSALVSTNSACRRALALLKNYVNVL